MVVPTFQSFTVKYSFVRFPQIKLHNKFLNIHFLWKNQVSIKHPYAELTLD
ncbi:hypothetical protein LEP1GSC079_3822 [Leptospira interrogans str. FPW1039]|uniref:Uncharacterized protein n=1 Tax=Leptospira interrogans str. FPW1039 TaxID=1193040 RepID=A0A0F6ICK1_LEPIR|nr:hypothetical protein LEP1GSC045_1377 [Leptospira interrogans serovar Pomona str. Kennewicki LC82-25]EKR37245.1 hypothetical protein LEP1GSC096_1872 [Leptospira interrogans serovar Hebdomadis str. R499]EKR82869.1 hypothetical protein LEP1GSC099_4129 [Leptospira interrogans str. UI 08452]EMF34138.1 hypothetical protein LEP1GSC201_0287 [Leptospira interrogans serovar Pomona str. Fox 32256]EMJ35776.1 hypothetical protein LEP1GSC079_3822 [Leptospira interrogans str. FPW1039]EMJ57849.1 hypothetic